MDIAEEGRWKVKICILVICLTRAVWYEAATADEEAYLTLARKGTKHTSNPVIPILAGSFIFTASILADSYFGKYFMMITLIVFSLLTNLMFIILSVAQYYAYKNIESIGKAAVGSFLLVYSLTGIRDACYVDLLRESNYKISLIFFCIMQYFEPIFMLTPLNAFYNMVLIFCVSLPIILFILYEIIKCKSYITHKPEKHGIMIEVFKTYIGKCKKGKVFKEEAVKIGNTILAMCGVLYITFTMEVTTYIIDKSWRWQAALFGFGSIANPNYIFQLLVIPSAFLWYYLFSFSKFYQPSRTTKVIISLVLQLIAIIFTIYFAHEGLRYFEYDPTSRSSQIRIINGSPLSFSFSTQTGKKNLDPGKCYKFWFFLEENVPLSITEANRSYKKLLYGKEGESVTYIMSNFGLIKVIGFDPVLHGPPGTNDNQKARLQIFSSHSGQIFIDKYHELPLPGECLIIPIEAGKTFCQVSAIAKNITVPINARKNGAYTLVIIFDPETEKLHHFIETMIEPLQHNSLRLFIPIVLAALGLSNSVMLALFFIFEQSPTSTRCSVISLNLCYYFFGDAVAKIIYSDGITALWISLLLHLINSCLAIRFSIMWKFRKNCI